MKTVDKIDRDVLMRSPAGDLYEVIGFICDPAVILRRLSDGAKEVIIPTSPIADEWVEAPAAECQRELLGMIYAKERL